MKAGTRTGAALVCALAIFAVAAIPAGASGGGAASKSACSLTAAEQGDALGSSYTYSLSARNLGCDKAKNLVVKLNQCRHDNGGRRGHCNGFKGYSCDQTQLDSSPTIYSAKVKCTKGSKKFVVELGELT